MQSSVDATRVVTASDALSRPLLVVGFCAAWCDTCGDFLATFDALAGARRDAAFVWLDIEDDADLAGDIDIENFPTLAVFDRGRPIHFGTSLPQASIVRRLLDSLDATSRTIAADAGIAGLPARLAAMTPEAATRTLRNA
jgi:thioredoxin 1